MSPTLSAISPMILSLSLPFSTFAISYATLVWLYLLECDSFRLLIQTYGRYSAQSRRPCPSARRHLKTLLYDRGTPVEYLRRRSTLSFLLQHNSVSWPKRTVAHTKTYGSSYRLRRACFVAPLCRSATAVCQQRCNKRKIYPLL